MKRMNPHAGPGARHRMHHPDGLFDPREDGPGHRHGPGHGPGGRGPRGPRGRGGRRAPRGDVRTAILLLLSEEPMHGYQLMQAIADSSGGRWTPSPGAIYPALNLLEDEGLVEVTADSGRKVAALTAAGRELVASSREEWADPFAAFGDGPTGPDLRDLLSQLHDATRQVGRSGTNAQVEAAATILTDAKRAMYLLLAGETEVGNG
jgi:DNA-binding PadR family transcriptional regulator